jgi:hypothetical protein
LSFVPAIAGLLAAICLPVQIVRAADDCLAKPGPVAAQGSHWYYRVDRATGRQCWYLAREGTRVRSNDRSVALPVRSQPSQQAERSNRQSPEVAAPAGPTFADATPDEAVPAAMSVRGAGAAGDESTAAVPEPRSDRPPQAASIESTAESLRPGYDAESQSGMAPSISPMAAPDARPVPEQALSLTISFAQLGAVLAVVGIAALVAGALCGLAAARRPGRSHALASPSSTSVTHRHRREVSWAFASTTGSGHEMAAPGRLRKSPPLQPRSPAVDYETSVRRLLQELQQRGSV